VPSPELRLAEDARWTVQQSGRWPTAELRATAAGTLALRSVDRCHLRETLRFPLLPALAHDLPLQGSSLEDVEFAPGALIFRRELHQAIFLLPESLRPTVAFELRCE
jgi:hypothetical protein